MLSFDLALQPGAAPRVLCLGAHCDDIEIGCGGAILRLARAYPELTIHWVVLSSTPERATEARASAEAFLAGVRNRQIIVQSFRDGFFPYLGAEIKGFFEELKGFRPDLIFTHTRHDLHQDHRATCELTWNTFRNHAILEYEIPKYDGDLGSPNFFVHLDQATCAEKIRLLLESFPSQHGKHWFTEETFRALMRIRGIESAAPELYAEGFYCRKIVAGLSPKADPVRS
jgi:LmbE family N-acetylglucosaminyl deacetylase